MKLPTLQAVAREGATAELWDDLPTISAAQYTSLMTGVIPQDSGRRTNDTITPVRLDTLPARVRAAGGTTAVLSDCVEWWPQLFPGDFDTARTDDKLRDAVAMVRTPATFTVIHLCGFDEAGHAFGGATEEYRQAGAQIDRTVAQLLEAWGSQGPVLITADHGHVDAGGHGGDEPTVRESFLVARGDGIAPGGHARGRLVDVAPTLAALLGVSAPASCEGQTLTGVLAVDASERARLEAVDTERIAMLERETQPHRAELLRAATVQRGVRGAVACIVLMLLLLWIQRRTSTWPGIGFGLITLVLSAAGYSTFVGAVSLSAHPRFGDLVAVTAKIGATAALLGIGVPALVVWRRRGVDDALDFILAATFGAAPLAGAMLVAFGFTAPRITLDSSWALALPSLAQAALAGTAGVSLILAVVISFLGNRRTG